MQLENHKSINLKGQKFFYKTYFKKGFSFTKFFQETKTVIQKGFMGFNSKVVEEPITIFEVDFNIESTSFDRKYCKQEIKKAFKSDKKEVKRKQELEKGIVI